MRTHTIALSLFLGAASLGFATASQALNPQPLPPGIRANGVTVGGVHTFHSVTAHQMTVPQATVPPEASMPSAEFSRTLKLQSVAASSPFTLTPQSPRIAARGYLQADQSRWDSGGNFIQFGAEQWSGVGVVIDATAGRTYLIDLSVQPNQNGCKFVVSTEDGQQSIYPCASAGSVQHLLFAYGATASGWVWFGVTNADSKSHFCAATIAQM